MVVGPLDSGKSTVSQILAAYAVRLDRSPILVDLDVSKGTLAVPGTLGAASLDRHFLDVAVIISLLCVLSM